MATSKARIASVIRPLYSSPGQPANDPGKNQIFRLNPFHPLMIRRREAKEKKYSPRSMKALLIFYYDGDRNIKR